MTNTPDAQFTLHPQDFTTALPTRTKKQKGDESVQFPAKTISVTKYNQLIALWQQVITMPWGFQAEALRDAVSCPYAVKDLI